MARQLEQADQIISRASAMGLSSIVSRRKIKAWLGQRLLRNVGWYGLVEVASRLSRLVTTVVLARALSSTELGVAAAALTCFELIRTLANTGIGQAVIRAPAERLAATCNTAYRTVWFVCLGVALLQIMAGAAFVASGQGEQTGLMLACLSLIYPVMAPGLIPVYLILRDNRLRVTAGISLAQVVADNSLTAVLALSGAGAWAIVLPKLLVAPIWLVGVRHFQTWRPDTAAGRVPVGEILRFALPVLGSEMLAAARLNFDNLLVLGVLGLPALGTYFFVFNAGIGFSLSLTNALNTVIYTHLAAGGQIRGITHRFDRAVLTVVLPAGLLIALQAAASLAYVPIVFGAHWRDAAPLVALLCLSAVTKPLSDAAAQLLRAANRPGMELIGSLLLTTIYLGVFAIQLRDGLLSGIIAIAVTATLLQLSFATGARLTAARMQLA